MGKTKELEKCVREAEQFLKVALYCREENIKSTFALIYPLFVNAALSCELYLKAIMMAESSDSTFKRGHHLQELFLNISLDAQNAVKLIYRQKNIYISLDDLLSRYGNNFVEWRYSFESGSEGNYLGIIGLAESLKAYIGGII